MDGRAGNEARAPIDAVGNKDGAGEIEGAVDTETMAATGTADGSSVTARTLGAAGEADDAVPRDAAFTRGMDGEEGAAAAAVDVLDAECTVAVLSATAVGASTAMEVTAAMEGPTATGGAVEMEDGSPKDVVATFDHPAAIDGAAAADGPRVEEAPAKADGSSVTGAFPTTASDADERCEKGAPDSGIDGRPGSAPAPSAEVTLPGGIAAAAKTRAAAGCPSDLTCPARGFVTNRQPPEVARMSLAPMGGRGPIPAGPAGPFLDAARAIDVAPYAAAALGGATKDVLFALGDDAVAALAEIRADCVRDIGGARLKAPSEPLARFFPVRRRSPEGCAPGGRGSGRADGVAGSDAILGAA